MLSPFLDGVSVATGWLYFTAWSLSFYPQVYDNWRRRSVVGLSFDYVMYNFAGHAFYAAFCAVSFLYAQPHFHLDAEVKANDLAFGVHAVLLTLVLIAQCLTYERGEQRLDPRHVAVCCVPFIGLALNCALAAAGSIPWVDTTNSSTPPWNAVQYLGIAKTALAFVKYLPQAALNRRRRSTEGWSIRNILLDLTGGVLSLAQNFIDAYNRSSWNIFLGNSPKLLLALVTIFFDTVFIVQHYVLYPHSGNGFTALPNEDQTDEEHGSVNALSTRGYNKLPSLPNLDLDP